jgi:hypothetical protein
MATNLEKICPSTQLMFDAESGALLGIKNPKAVGADFLGGNGVTLPIATAAVLGGVKAGKNLLINSVTGVASVPRPSALSTAADKISDKAAWGRKLRLLTTAVGVAGVPNAGAATVYWPWVIRATDRLTSPIDKFYMYYSTDHDAGAGGIWLATAPTPEGPWTVYGLVYTDAGGGQSETPSVVWDRENSRYCMMYQIQAAVTNGTAARGVQSTVACYSTNGINWTKDPNFIIDIPFANTQVGDGHTGYFLPFETRRGLFAYSLYGGTNSYGNVLWKSNGDLSGLVINAGNGTYGTGWHSDRKHLGYGLDMTIPVAAFSLAQYINWNHSFVAEAQGTEYWIGVIANLVSGGDPKICTLAAAPVSANYRALTEAPRIIWTPDQAWESADLRSVTPFVDDGRLYIYYTVNKTEIGVISYAL